MTAETTEVVSTVGEDLVYLVLYCVGVLMDEAKDPQVCVLVVRLCQSVQREGACMRACVHERMHINTPM